MGHSHYDPGMQNRPAWNAGKMVGTKRPLTKKQIWAVRFFLDCEVRLHDRALLTLRSTANCVAATWSRSRSATSCRFELPASGTLLDTGLSAQLDGATVLLPAFSAAIVKLDHLS